MTKVARVCISVEGPLLAQFESFLASNGYPTRSEAMKGLMRQALIEQEWQRDSNVAGAISIVYDHHKRGTMNGLTAVQHDFGHVILCSQHIHLDHHNCMEVIVVRSHSAEIRKLLMQLKSVKGIKHSSLMVATTDKVAV